MARSKDDKAQANPTKEFFISMITRDLDIEDAINDLVDNSVDGARRLRPDGDYSGLKVEVRLEPAVFEVKDNCGGISLDIARNYAFRFGRPDNASAVDYSVGRFGIGMKRALFRLGGAFKITSSTAGSRFTIEIKVSDWAREPTVPWFFPMKVEEGVSFAEAETGTTILISDPVETLKDRTNNHVALGMLMKSLANAHGEAIRRGLSVTVDGTPAIVAQEVLLSVPGKLGPRVQKCQHAPDDLEPVMIWVYCGLGESSPPRAGWYVYCNGRLVLDADKKALTGWGEKDETTMPRFHNEFSRFRGFVYFTCKDPDRLPWNTTKTGLDEDSRVWRATRPKMLEAMREVIDYLYALKKWAGAAEEVPDEFFESKVLGTSAKQSAPFEISRARQFLGWLPPEKKGPAYGTIQYRRPVRMIAAVKEALGASSNVQVGEMTFDLFCDQEGIE